MLLAAGFCGGADFAARAAEMIPYPGTEAAIPAADAPAVDPPTVALAVTAHVRLDTVFFPQAAWGEDLLKAQAMKPAPAFFTAGQFDAVVPAPARNSSAQTRGELDQLLAQQNNERKPDIMRLINSENDIDGPIAAFTQDSLFEPFKHPKTKKLLDAVGSAVDYYVMQYKMKYQRALPTQLEPRLTAVIMPPRTASYPSNYAALGQGYAAILGKLDPANQASYAQRAADISLRREIAGVQYPSDGVAGRKLANAIVEAMLAQLPFQDMFKDAQTEYTGKWK